MANVLLNSQLLTSQTLAEFVASQSFLATADRQFEKDFTNQYYQTGQSLNIRKRVRFIAQQGVTAVFSDINEEYETLTIDLPYYQAFSFTSLDETFTTRDYQERYFSPAARSITAKIETAVADAIKTQVRYVIGTPGQSINSFNAVSSIETMMGSLDMPVDRAYLALNLSDAQYLKSALQNAFNPILNQEISFGNRLGRLGIFDIFKNSCLLKHKAGTASQLAPNTVTITNGPISTGDVLSLSGLPVIAGNTDPDALKVGDVLVINPAANSQWVSLLKFAVTDYSITAVVKTFTPGVGGAGTVTVNFNMNAVANTAQLISAPIPNGTTLTVYGDHNNSIAYCQGGLSMVNPMMVPLQTQFSKSQPDKDMMLSLNISMWGDGENLTDRCRITALAGKKWHPDYCIRVIS